MFHNYKLPRTTENSHGVISVKKIPLFWVFCESLGVLLGGAVSFLLTTYVCILMYNDGALTLGRMVVLYPMPVFLICFGWAIFSTEIFSFGFVGDGIKIKRPFRKEQLIGWDEFQQICICYNGSTTKGERKAFSVICFVKNGEKKNHLYRWNTFHYKNVITIYYSDEILTELNKYCPYDVVDLRKTTAYRL